MEQQVTINIDGREISTSAGCTILDAAKDANIYIPHLCQNDELKPYGSCRLCIVEINQGKKTRMVTSCIYEAADGLQVNTKSERVINVRKLVIELMLARNPYHHSLKKIADELGVSHSRFQIDKQGCILCGQCIRTCREVVGVSAISYKNRGHTREVATPFDSSPPDCIACGACSYICPVQVIPLKEKDGVRTIWKTDFPLQKCKKCGRYIAPVKQLEYFSKITNVPESHFDHCLLCR